MRDKAHETEVEIKLAVESARAARRQLARLGFRVAQARHFEQNTLYDTPRGSLHRHGVMLRLRVVDGRAVLTFKGRARKSDHYKVRTEAETSVASAQAARTVLDGLGYGPTFRYEKYRTVFARYGESGEVLVDETPIGTFLELEGPARWIRRVARQLGREPSEFLIGTYGDLYRAWRRCHGGAARAMVFRRKR